MRYENNHDFEGIGDIHQNSFFEMEKNFAKKFIEDHFENGRPALNCPLSGIKKNDMNLKVFGLPYGVCPSTWNVSLNVEPSENNYQEYFSSSSLARLRQSTNYQEEQSKARALYWEDFADWIEHRSYRYLQKASINITDVGSRYKGWIDTLKGRTFFKEVFCSDALPPVESNELKGFSDVLILQDVFQRLIDPYSYFKNILSLIKPKGLIMLTCRSGSGFDVLAFSRYCQSIFPLDHILLPSPKGIRQFLESLGLNILELSTPGSLDTTWCKTIKNDLDKDQLFQKYLLNQGDDVLHRFQQFLQQNNLSSHIRVVAQKVTDDV